MNARQLQQKPEKLLKELKRTLAKTQNVPYCWGTGRREEGYQRDEWWTKKESFYFITISERWEFGCWFSKNVWTYTTESVFGFCDGCLNCRGLAYYIYRQGWQLRPGYCHDCVKSWLKVPVDLDKLAYSFCWIDHISLSNFLSWLSNVCKEVSTSQNWRVQFLPFQDGVVETKVLLLFL
jgi:hypothetical protein